MKEILFGRKIILDTLMEYYNAQKDRMLNSTISIYLILSIVFFLVNSTITVFLENLSANNNVFLINNMQLISLLISVVLDFIAPTAIIIPIYRKLDFYFDHIGWKKKYPHLDLSGEWVDTTEYTKCINNSSWKEANITSVPSTVHIEQTCHSISIKPSSGDGFIWKSLTANLNDNTLDILYNVQYNHHLQTKGYPEQRTGYEQMKIILDGLNQKERPKKMVGKFWHCIQDDNKPIYMGDVIYERKA